MIDSQDVFKLKICFNLLLGPRAPSPAMSAKRRKRKRIVSNNFVLTTLAGEGARGPSKRLIVRIPGVWMFLFS